MKKASALINNLTWGYNGKDILNSIDLKIEKGTFNGIVGPNGAGKTTLLKLLLKLLPCERGRIYIQTEDIVNFSRKELARKMSYVPQTPNMNLGFSVEQIVSMGRNPHLGVFEQESDSDRTIIRQVMEETQIYHLRENDISRISGGELQRVIIARALAQEPDILALDEPTSHLDINHQIRILSLIRSLSTKKEITVIAILHDFNHALEYCDNLFLMNDGKIESYGNPEEVITPGVMKKIYDLEVKIEQNPFTGKPYMVTAV